MKTATETTFKVSDVVMADRPLTEVTYKQAAEAPMTIGLPEEDRRTIVLYPGEGPNREAVHGPTIERFPGGRSKAPFRWQYFNKAIEMEFLGGFVGVAQDPQTLALRPEIGWAVREAGVAA